MNWSDEQLNALNKLKEFVTSKEDVIVLQGFAGSGKTALMKEYIKYLEDNNICYRLCAPTHKAKLVLKKVTDRDTITIHKLCNLSPNLNILELNLLDLQFNSADSNEFPYKGIVIVDEASMINDDLYDLLLKNCKNYKSKIVFICDIAQLMPVNNGGISKVFKNNTILNLTKIFRQTEINNLSTLLMKLRHKVVRKYESSDDMSILIYHNIKSFIDSYIEKLKHSIKIKDLNYVKLITYTNKRINDYNTCIRKILYNDDELFHIGELLVGLENYKNQTVEFYNSSDYIITSINKINKRIPYYGIVNGYNLILFDGEINQEVFVIDPNEDLKTLAITIESIRINAITNQNKRIKSQLWRKYYALTNSFATFKELVYENRVIKSRTFNYGYAISTHKSQGSSYNSVYVDMKNLLLDKNEIELRQLQYVALSRTRTNVNIYI